MSGKETLILDIKEWVKLDNELRQLKKEEKILSAYFLASNYNIILETLIKNKIDKNISIQFIYLHADIINNNIIDINNNNNNNRNILVNDWISKVKCELLSYSKSNLLLTELNELIKWNTFLETFYSQNIAVYHFILL